MANTAVFGIYSSRGQVEMAVDHLRAAGFRAQDISVLFPENVGTKEFAHEKHTKAPEGTAAGAASGAVVGGTLGWLAGIGAPAIPGSVRSSPRAPSWRRWGMAVGAVGAGRRLIGLGIPGARPSGTGNDQGWRHLLSVHSDSHEWTKLAKEILENTGASDVASTSEAKGDYANADRPGTRRDI